MNSPASCCTAVARFPGLYSADPIPKPLAPAARQGAMLSGVMPPTGNTSVPTGSTASMALSTAGDAASAGNSLSPWAPATSAANASVGVAMPGRQTRPRRTASRTTSGLKLGDTISSPPAACTSRTWAASRTVPAPTSAPGWRCASRAILFSGCGELSGTSSNPKPAWASASPMAGASAGVSPRKIATSGIAWKAVPNFCKGVMVWPGVNVK